MLIAPATQAKSIQHFDCINGIVSDFSEKIEPIDRVEVYGAQYLVRVTQWTSWNFRVTLHDQQGNLLNVIPVYMGGYMLIGMVRIGDRVQIDVPWHEGEILYATRLLNLTTNSWVGKPDYPPALDMSASIRRRRVIVMAIVLLFAALTALGHILAIAFVNLVSIGQIFTQSEEVVIAIASWITGLIAACIATPVLVFVFWLVWKVLEWIGLVGRQ